MVRLTWGAEYVNLHNLADRKIILKGPNAIAIHYGLVILREERVGIVFDV